MSKFSIIIRDSKKPLLYSRLVIHPFSHFITDVFDKKLLWVYYIKQLKNLWQRLFPAYRLILQNFRFYLNLKRKINWLCSSVTFLPILSIWSRGKYQPEWNVKMSASFKPAELFHAALTKMDLRHNGSSIWSAFAIADRSVRTGQRIQGYFIFKRGQSHILQNSLFIVFKSVSDSFSYLVLPIWNILPQRKLLLISGCILHAKMITVLRINVIQQDRLLEENPSNNEKYFYFNCEKRR